MKIFLSSLTFWLSLGAVVVIILLALVYRQAHPPLRESAIAGSAGENTRADANGEELKKLTLELKTNRSELATGECADLRLDVSSLSGHPIRWEKNWVFQQEGPSPPVPESFPRSTVQLAPGTTVGLVLIRVCRADLIAGTYRYRICTAPESTEPSCSNWVTLEALP